MSKWTDLYVSEYDKAPPANCEVCGEPIAKRGFLVSRTCSLACAERRDATDETGTRKENIA